MQTGNTGASVAASGNGDASSSRSLIGGLLNLQDILLGLEAANRRELFDAVDRHVAHAHGLPKGLAALSLTNRERIGSTGLGAGVAVPHARLRQLGHVCLVYARLGAAIDFGAPDGHPVQHVLVLLVPEQACQQHLDIILADMTRVFQNPRFRQRLHRCNCAQEVKQLFGS